MGVVGFLVASDLASSGEQAAGLRLPGHARPTTARVPANVRRHLQLRYKADGTGEGRPSCMHCKKTTGVRG